MSVGDPYQDQLLETSKAVAEKAGVKQWQFTWQSAGRTAEPWLGPDILDTLQTLNKEEQVEDVLVAPVGFVSDHLEVLYDLDIEAKSIAKEMDMRRAHRLLEQRPALYGSAQRLRDHLDWTVSRYYPNFEFLN